MGMKLTRIYKYQLEPTDLQKKELEKVGGLSRFLWNRLVKTMNHALREMDSGRRGTIEEDYINIIKNKDDVGMRVATINKLALENNLSFNKAKDLFIQTKTEKLFKIPKRKDGSRMVKWSNQHLAWNYALEKVNSQRTNIVPPKQKIIWTSIMQKWTDCCKNWDNLKIKHAQKPRFKKMGKISSIQKQISKTSKWSMGENVDLSWSGSKSLSFVKVIYHRSIPDNVDIKQIALVKSPMGEWFICVFLQGEKEVFEKNFMNTGKSVGVDPGIKTAFTTSDGEYISPPMGLSRMNNIAKKLRKFQRKLDRQRRVNNPDCYNPDGTFKRGKYPRNKSKSMIQLEDQINGIYEYLKNSREDYYHNIAIDLLNKYDDIGIGDWRHNKKLGTGKSKRAINLKTSEHAISAFVDKLKDKAKLSRVEKNVCDVNEWGTTKTDSRTGERLNLKLSDRVIVEAGGLDAICRDVNAAINIREKMISEKFQKTS